MLKKIAPHLIAIFTFALVCTIYFYPEIQGQELEATDVISYTSMMGELNDYKEATGETSNWNNGMFGGMPWALLIYGREWNATSYVAKGISKVWQERSPRAFFTALITSYLVLILLGISPWLSIIGAFAYAFNTNFIVLTEAGHRSKVDVLSYFPLIVGGSILAFQQKKLTGGLIFAIGCSLAIYFNHIQMLYYLVLLMVLLYGVYLLINILVEKKPVKEYLFPILFLIVAGVLAIGANAAQLYSSRSYAEDTMRGAPILSKDNSKADVTSSSEIVGLEWNYVNRWSNNWGDVLSILIPSMVGGSSAEEVKANSEMGRLLRGNGAQVSSDNTVRAPLYWGDLPFTSGPHYLGAVVIFLFVLSLTQLKRSWSYGILAAVLIGLAISFGKNASWLVRPLYDYLPLFNKFRGHSSIVNVVPSIMVIAAFWGLQTFFNRDNNSGVKVKNLLIAAGVSGGIALLVGLFGPGMFDFLTANEAQYQAQIQSIFIDTRSSVLRSDAFRSFALILAAALGIWSYLKGYIKSKYFVYSLLGLLIVLDLWSVGRRYLDKDTYSPAREYNQNFEPRPVDQQILSQEPKGRGFYRVFDQSISTFNDARSSRFFNTIGGYSPAKLQRIQDVIDEHISKGNMATLNMLNTKYFITPEQQVQINSGALGNAWFVDNLVFVNTPREEIDQLSNFEPAKTAVILRDEFDDVLGSFQGGDGLGSIELVSYAPNRLVYQTSSSSEQLAVFSEVWYGPDKGWNATIDGQSVDILRANYLLRAMKVPAGTHEIIMEFKPKMPTLLRVMTIGSSWAIFLGFIGFFGFHFYKWIQEPLPIEKKPKQVKKTKKSKTSKKPNKSKKRGK